MIRMLRLMYLKGIALSAVSRAFSTLIIAIRNTVDSGGKKVNETLSTIK